MSSVNDAEISELNELRAIRDKLSEENRKLSAQNIELHSKLLSINRMENYKNHLLGVIKEKEAKIQTLTEEKNNVIQSKNDELKELDRKYSKELYYLKNQVENNSQKLESANQILDLNNKQFAKILELEEKVEVMQNRENEYIKLDAIKHENEYSKLRKKMMNHIKTAQRNMIQSNIDNSELNNKLNILTTNQLLIELEQQAIQVSNLLKIKERLEKQIFTLKTDLNTHLKVENILKEKNEKYIKMVRKYDKKFLLAQEDSKNICPTSRTIESVKPKNYEKIYKKQGKELISLKEDYNYLKEKIANYEKDNIMQIEFYNKILNAFTEHNKLDILQNGNINTLSKTERYSLLNSILNKVVPIINDDENSTIVKSQSSTIDNCMGRNQGFFNTTNTHYFKTLNSEKYLSNYKTFTRFPKVEHLNVEYQRTKNFGYLYKFLNDK